MLEKVIVALVSAILSASLTYGAKAVQIEGRIDGIERAVIRIENKLDRELKE